MKHRRYTEEEFINSPHRLPNMDLRAMDLFWPMSSGAGFNGPMRLVALLLMLHDSHGEYEVHWDHDQIADRTGLPVSVVATALDQLRQVRLVEETAAGPRLTWSEWDTYTKPDWIRQGIMRPTLQPGSSKQSTAEENENGNGQLEASGDEAGAGS